MNRSLALLLLTLLAACSTGHPNSSYLPDRSGITEGQTITVKGNENIYSVAHEYNVSMRELIALNNLKPPFEVRPGQTLVLPANGASFNGNMPPPAAAPLAPVEKNALPPLEPAGVTSEQLAPLAPVALPPVQSSASPQPLGALPPAAMPKTVAPLATAEPIPALNHPSVPHQQTATTMTSAGAGASSISMEWPVQGPIISAFGSKGPGLNNDGINIGAPKGAPVVAAASGTVVYAGDEMKGFGNLVLIRHEGDWVTAYAHLDRVLVKKDSVVGQGDMIGTVGKTGNVPSPQLHFETRQAGKPVDPAGVIKTSL